jgi:hypothetical protein
MGTLLGPERTTEPAPRGRAPPGGDGLLFQYQAQLGKHTDQILYLGSGVFCGVVGWSLVENCTVDASILFSVVKLSRANGGCLGTRSR